MCKEIIILDGGMGRELARRGAPFRQPEWSALALMEAPHFVRQAHDAFIAAGSQVITTNSYAVVPFHIGEQRFAEHGPRLIRLAASLARDAADAAGHPVSVAASLPPVLGSYRPDLFNPEQARKLMQVMIENQREAADLWLAETLSSLAEAHFVAEMLNGDDRPLWLAFTLNDELTPSGQAVLRSGEAVSAAVSMAVGCGAEAILFNCSRIEVMTSAVCEAQETLQSLTRPVAIGVYANAFDPSDAKHGANEGLSEMRKDTGPQSYLTFAREWVTSGASIIGGCCGIGPEHIAVLSKTLNN